MESEYQNPNEFTANGKRDITLDYHEDYEVVHHEQTSTSRWDVHFKTVVKRADDTHWMIRWSRGATEQQDYDSFEIDPSGCEFKQVRPTVKLATKWVSKDEYVDPTDLREMYSEFNERWMNELKFTDKKVEAEAREVLAELDGDEQ